MALVWCFVRNVAAMFRRMRKYSTTSALFLALLAAACGSDASGTDSGPEQQIATLGARFLDAFNKGDASALASLFAEDGVRVISGAQLPSTGREQIKKLFEADLAQHNANLDNRLSSKLRAVRALGDGILVADGAFELKSLPTGTYLLIAQPRKRARTSQTVVINGAETCTVTVGAVTQEQNGGAPK